MKLAKSLGDQPVPTLRRDIYSSINFSHCLPTDPNACLLIYRPQAQPGVLHFATFRRESVSNFFSTFFFYQDAFEMDPCQEWVVVVDEVANKAFKIDLFMERGIFRRFEGRFCKMEKILNVKNEMRYINNSYIFSSINSLDYLGRYLLNFTIFPMQSDKRVIHFASLIVLTQSTIFLLAALSIDISTIPCIFFKKKKIMIKIIINFGTFQFLRTTASLVSCMKLDETIAAKPRRRNFESSARKGNLENAARSRERAEERRPKQDSVRS